MKIFLTPLSILLALSLLTKSWNQPDVPPTPLNPNISTSLEAPAPIAMPMATANSMEELMDNMGMDMSMMPPIAWTATKKIQPGSNFTFNIIQKHNNGGLVLIDWGNGTEAFNASGTTASTFTRPYNTGTAVGTTFDIKVYTCEDDIYYLDIMDEELTALDVSELTGLKIINAAFNYIRSNIDLTQCNLIENVNFSKNNNGPVGNTGGPGGTNEILFPASCPELTVVDIAYSVFDNLVDLNGASSVELIRVELNSIDYLNLPAISSRPNHPLWILHADGNEIEGSFNVSNQSLTELDISGFPNLENVNLDDNDLFNLILDDLPALKTFVCGNNPNLRTSDGTYTNNNSPNAQYGLDFRLSPLIETIAISNNRAPLPGATGSGGWGTNTTPAGDAVVTLPGPTQPAGMKECIHLKTVIIEYSAVIGTLDFRGTVGSSTAGSPTEIKTIGVRGNKLEKVHLPPSNEKLETFNMSRNLVEGTQSIKSQKALINANVGDNLLSGLELKNLDALEILSAGGNRINTQVDLTGDPNGGLAGETPKLREVTFQYNGPTSGNLTVDLTDANNLEVLNLYASKYGSSLDLSDCLKLRVASLNTNPLDNLILPDPFASSPQVMPDLEVFNLNATSIASTSTPTLLDILTRIEAYGNTAGGINKKLYYPCGLGTFGPGVPLYDDLTANKWFANPDPANLAPLLICP